MSAGHNHFRKVCKHGRVVAQCRCIGPKTEIIAPCLPECDREVRYKREEECVFRSEDGFNSPETHEDDE